MIIATILVFIILLLLFLIFPAKSSVEQRRPFQNRSFAHRGLHSKDRSVPENSIAAFKAAVDAGYGIELDIRLTKDGQVVVFHDDDLQRVCGVPGFVRDFTYAELQRLTLFDSSERIPLFEEILPVVGGRTPLIIEFKTGPSNPLLCKKAMQLLDSYKGDYCMESFDPRIVGWFKKNAKHVLRGQLSAPLSMLGRKMIYFLLSHLLFNFISRPHFVAYYEKKHSVFAKLCDLLGAMRFVWTVNENSNINEIMLKNDAIIFEHIQPPV